MLWRKLRFIYPNSPSALLRATSSRPLASCQICPCWPCLPSSAPSSYRARSYAVPERPHGLHSVNVDARSLQHEPCEHLVTLFLGSSLPLKIKKVELVLAHVVFGYKSSNAPAFAFTSVNHCPSPSLFYKILTCCC